MSFVSDLTRLKNSRWGFFSGGALLIGLCAGTLLWYSSRYDYPPLGKDQRQGTIKFLRRDWSYTVTCDCPPYMIAEKSRTLKFEIVVQLKPPAQPSPEAVPPKLGLGTAIAMAVGISTELKGAGGPLVNMGFADDSEFLANLREETSVSQEVKPLDGSDWAGVGLHLNRYEPSSGKVVADLSHIDYSIPVRAPFGKVLQPVLYSILVVLVAFILLYLMDRKYRLMREEDEQRLQAAQKSALENPKQASLAWELAGANLQSYFTRNLAQVRQVFNASVAVMVAGFACVLYGVYVQVGMAHISPGKITPPTWVASISGLITQFIGATFMVIYRSTMAQANEFVIVLDRINTVGIAMRVLDQVPDDAPSKNDMREKLISLLLRSQVSAPHADAGEAPREVKSGRSRGAKVSSVSDGH